MGDALPVPNRQAGVAQVDPRLVQPEGFDAIGVFLIDPAHALAETDIEPVIRRYADQIRAFLPRLPDGFPGLYAELLCDLVFGQHDAMAFLHAAAYRHGTVANGRRVEAFDAGIERIGVAMENHPLHDHPSRYRI